MYQVTPHRSHPPSVQQRADSHSRPAPGRNPAELLWSMQHKGDDMLCQLKQRYEAVFDACKGGALGRRRHGLHELLSREVEDPETETR